MKKAILIKNMSELGAGTRGASLGFDAMEIAALKNGSNVFKDLEIIKFPNLNNDLYHEVEIPYAIHIRSILKSASINGDKLGQIFTEGTFPFIISGDHSNAATTIYAIRKAFPEKRLGVVWIDAHGDLHSPYTTPSGNMHGMPLAISLAEDNLDMKCNDPSDLAVERWNELKNLGGMSPKINPEDLVFFAVRDTEKPEDFIRNKYGIRNFEVNELREKSIKSCLKEAKERLEHCDLIYVSFDVDSMDCDLVSRGTGTPVKNGLRPEEALEIMQGFIKDERLICLEILEVNPLLDNKGNVMAETAADILDKLVSTYLK